MLLTPVRLLLPSKTNAESDSRDPFVPSNNAIELSVTVLGAPTVPANVVENVISLLLYYYF